MKTLSESLTDGRSALSPFTLLVFLSIDPIGVVAQHQEPASPAEVVRAYRKADGAGERLTTRGWYEASKFFVKADRPPSSRAVAVIDGERVDEHVFIDGNRAEVQVPCSIVGQLDALGRFTFVVHPLLLDAQGHLSKRDDEQLEGPEPLVIVYQLVLTGRHREFGPAGEGPQEVEGPVQWRIEHFQYEPWVRIDAAMRYLTRLQNGASDEVVRRNAAKSITVLRRLLSR